MKIREKVLNAKDKALRGQTLTHADVPEWLDEGDEILVQSISEATRAELHAECSDGKDGLDMAKFRPALLIETLTDPHTGKLAFSRADRDALASKDVRVFERVFWIAMRVCGFAEPEVLEKNSEKTEGSEPASVSQKGSTKASRKSSD